jgi:uncharacterized membrane protein YphA (DoxX/SURF4 family)
VSVGAWAAVAVGVVLLASGAAKVVSPSWPAQAAALGVGQALARIVPPLEVALGALLVAGVAPTLAGACAAALLTLFTVFLVVHLRRGDRVPCACFGVWSSRPVGPWSVVRNVVLVALAVVAAVS